MKLSHIDIIYYFSTKFIINHIAKPPVMSGKLEGWDDDMAAIAKFPNVYCKM